MPDENEYEVAVRAVEVHRRCEVSGCTGEMKSVGPSTYQMGFEPIWDHVCTVCGSKTHSWKQYPCIEFRPT